MRDGLTEYVPHVYRLTMRLTGDAHRAEDLTQETFLRAWQKQAQLKDERAARVWLFRIAVNLWNDELRRGRLSPSSNADTSCEHLGDSATPPDRGLENRDDLAQAFQLLDSLPTRQRAVLYLTAVEELSLSEVADVLQIDRNTAKVNLSHARKRMRDELAKLTNHHE